MNKLSLRLCLILTTVGLTACVMPPPEEPEVIEPVAIADGFGGPIDCTDPTALGCE